MTHCRLQTEAPKLVDQQRLVGVAPSQTIRGMDIQALDPPAAGGVAKALESRAHEDGAAVAFVNVTMIRLELKAIGCDPLAQRGDLAGDRVLTRLAVAGNPSINGDTPCDHGLPPDPVAVAVLGVRDCGASSRVGRRPSTRPRRSPRNSGFVQSIAIPKTHEML